MKDQVVKCEGGTVKLLSGFEGPYAFPKYSQNLEEKNLNNVAHLIRRVPDMHLSTLQWEAGLRGGYSTLKKDKKIKLGFNEKSMQFNKQVRLKIKRNKKE